MATKDKPLVLDNFSKYYGSDIGVDEISIELEPGEVFGFLGPNGAGKSTAIRSILNFIKPTKGTISIFGLDSVEHSVEAKHHIGYLAGDIALYENMTGRQILEYLTTLGKKTDWNYVDTLATKLKANLDRPIKSLSKGNKQKIGLIQAFMHKPKLLVLDEPTSGLDPLMKQVFYDMVLEMKKEGITVFVSSHDLTEVQKICDRAAFIREGRLISIENVKKAKGLNLRRYTVTFKDTIKAQSFDSIKGATEIKTSGKKLMVTINGDVNSFISEIAKHHPTDLNEEETTLEDIFMHYYDGGAKS